MAKQQTAVIGLGLFGREIALGLTALGHSVLAIDRDRELVEQLRNGVEYAVALDSTDEGALYEVGVDKLDTAVCAIGAQNIEASIMTTALLHQLRVPRIVARAADDLHARILRQVGAHEVVNPEKAMGRRIAKQIARPGLREVLRLTHNLYVAEVPVPLSFVDRSIVDLNIRQDYGINVIGVQRGQLDAAMLLEELAALAADDDQVQTGGEFLVPTPDLILRGGDILVLTGQDADIQRLAGGA